MSKYNKLSLELLADAFSREECEFGIVFALYGAPETIAVVRSFLISIKRDNFGTLFGVPFFVDNRFPEGVLALGVRRAGGYPAPSPEDVSQALQKRVTSDKIPPDQDTWSRTLDLR